MTIGMKTAAATETGTVTTAEIARMEMMTMNETDTHQDMADFKPPTKEQEDEILLLELNRLRKKGTISQETFIKTREEWGL